MKKIWLEHYPIGVPHHLDLKDLRSIPDVFEQYCEKFSQHCFFSQAGVDKTYADIRQQARYFAAFLQQELQLNPGDRFAIILPNMLQFPIALFGALLAGLIVVPLNPFYTSRELLHPLQDAGVKAAIILENTASVLEEILVDTPLKQVILTGLGDCLGCWKGTMMHVWHRYIQHKFSKLSIRQAISFKQSLKKGAQLSLKKVSIKQEDMALLQYTSGVQGVPKGAMLTHGNILANIRQNLAFFGSSLSERKEVVLTVLPLYHIFSLNVCCLSFMAYGAQHLLILNPKNRRHMIRALKKKSVTIFVGVNTFLKNILQYDRFHTMNFSSLKLVITGGMATEQAVAEEWYQQTGVVVRQGYGLTEASPVVSMTPLNVMEYTGSVGLPLPETDISIRDNQGAEIPLGKSGELYVQGPQVMQGYWHQPSETKHALDDKGWLKTGDIARMDSRGWLYIVGRKKEMIVVSGFNVYPDEVEAVMSRCPGVLEVAVVGIADSKTGEAVKACIIPSVHQHLRKSDILAYCRQQLAAYKIPKVIEFRDELPKNNMGKVLRRLL